MATLKQLKTFVAVAEHKKMSEAAKHLYISQPTVSQIISDLEMEYETPLFERLPKELRITDAGNILLTRAKEIIAIHDDLEQAMKDIHARRPLRIGATLTIGNTMMASLTSQLLNLYPDIDASVCITNTKQIEEMLLHNELDIALVEGIINHKEILTNPVLEDNLCLICGKNHPFVNRGSVSVKDLQNETFIMREKGSGTRAIFENLMASHQIPYQVRWESNSSSAIIDAVHYNLGLGFLSERCVFKHLNLREIYPCNVEEISLKRYFYLCRSKYHPLTSQISDFISLVQSMSQTDKENLCLQ